MGAGVHCTPHEAISFILAVLSLSVFPTDYGKEKSLPLSNYSSDEVLKALETLAVDSSVKD